MVLLISALLFLAALVLIAGQLLNQRRRERLVNQRLQGQLVRGDRLGTLLSQFGSSQLAQRSSTIRQVSRSTGSRTPQKASGSGSKDAACARIIRVCQSESLAFGPSSNFLRKASTDMSWSRIRKSLIVSQRLSRAFSSSTQPLT